MSDDYHTHDMPSLRAFTDGQIEAFEQEWYSTEQGKQYKAQKEQHLKRFIQDKLKMLQ